MSLQVISAVDATALNNSLQQAREEMGFDQTEHNIRREIEVKALPDRALVRSRASMIRCCALTVLTL